MPESRIALALGKPLADVDYISLRLQNAKGTTVDEWTVEEPDWGDEENPVPADYADPEGNWRLLDGLFSEVHRSVTGWDKVMSDIEKALAGPGPIGLTPKPGIATPGGAAGTGRAGTPTVAVGRR